MCPFFLWAHVYKIDAPHALLRFSPGSHCEVGSYSGDTCAFGIHGTKLARAWEVAFQNKHSIAVHPVLHFLSHNAGVYFIENMYLKPHKLSPSLISTIWFSLAL